MVPSPKWRGDREKMPHADTSFTDIAQRLGPLVDAALDARTQPAPGWPERLRAAMRHSLLAPGKRIRPLLVLLATEACGGKFEAALPAACAVEMVHAYSLIHDDLPALDNDDLRRGRPTCHKAFDEATAILAGDGLLTFAFEVLAKEVQPPSTAALCCAALAQAAGPCNMVGGQADDISGQWPVASGQCETASESIPNPRIPESPVPSPPSPAPFALLESIHQRKTGAMIRVSLKLGGLTAGANGEQLAALDTYGDCLGMTFQIIDDLLDVESSAEAMGKRTGKDAAQGKLTFPAVLGIDHSRQFARQLTDRAIQALDIFGPAAAGLRTVAHFVLERNR
jgi:geranylgeranyl diphosphate synthase type II